MNAGGPVAPAQAKAPAQVPVAAPFFNLVNLLLQPDDSQGSAGDPNAASPGTSPDTAAGPALTGSPLMTSPAQIADALLRSMFGAQRAAGAQKKNGNLFGDAPPNVAVQIFSSQNPLLPSGVPIPVPVSPAALASVLPQNAADSAGPAPQVSPPVVAAEGVAAAHGVVDDTAPSRALPPAVPGPEPPLAFGAKLTPKSAEPDSPSSPQGPSLPVPAPAAAALSKRAPQREPEIPVLQSRIAPAAELAGHVTATPLAAGVFSRPSPASAPAVADPQPVAAPPQAEPAAASTSPLPLREVTLRIAPQGAPPVDIQVNQRQGEVHVVVRTPDEGMQLSLRQDLPQLVNALDRAGYHTETFTPHAASEMAVASAGQSTLGNSSQDASQDSTQNPGRDPSQERGPSERDASNSAGARDQQPQQQRQRDQQTQRWLDQMEE